jgi:hypothetical protein
VERQTHQPFQARGKSVTVITAVHPEQDLLAVSIESPSLLTEDSGAGRVSLWLAEYGSGGLKSTAKHQSTVIGQTSSTAG